jgi:hypothetical protein
VTAGLIFVTMPAGVLALKKVRACTDMDPHEYGCVVKE